MMDLGSSLGISSVSQGSIKRCIDKTKTRRQFLCCSKPLLQVVLSGFFYFLPVISSFYRTALLSLALSQTQLFSHTPLCFSEWCASMCR